MEPELQAAIELIAASVDKAKAIEAKAKEEKRELTDAETDELAKLGETVKTARAKRDELKAKIEKRNQAGNWVADAEKDQGEFKTPRRVAAPTGNVQQPDSSDEPKKVTIPAEAKRYRARNFSGKDADLKAFRFGMYMMAAFGRARARKWCAEHGIEILAAGHVEGDNELGGFWVPEEFDTDLILLREQFGVFRRYARISPMTSEKKTRNKHTSGLTATWEGEAGVIDSSKRKWSRVQLIAKKLTALAVMSKELSEDAAINIGDDLAREIAYAFAEKEDRAGFLGDGTATYGHIMGFVPAILGLDATPGNIAGIVTASGNSWGAITKADFVKCIGRLPDYADTPGVGWYCHRAFWAEVMGGLQFAMGGASKEDLSSPTGKSFMGYPVVVSQVFPRVSAASTVQCLFGDLSLAADFGDRRGLSIEFSKDATVDGENMFTTDQIAVKGTERCDITVHSVGNASATAANRVAGPVVALYTPA